MGGSGGQETEISTQNITKIPASDDFWHFDAFFAAPRPWTKAIWLSLPGIAACLGKMCFSWLVLTNMGLPLSYLLWAVPINKREWLWGKRLLKWLRMRACNPSRYATVIVPCQNFRNPWTDHHHWPLGIGSAAGDRFHSGLGFRALNQRLNVGGHGGLWSGHTGASSVVWWLRCRTISMFALQKSDTRQISAEFGYYIVTQTHKKVWPVSLGVGVSSGCSLGLSFAGCCKGHVDKVQGEWWYLPGSLWGLVRHKADCRDDGFLWLFWWAMACPGVVMFWTAIVVVGSLMSVQYIYEPFGWFNSPLGRYMVREERFITEQEAQEWDYKDWSDHKPMGGAGHWPLSDFTWLDGKRNEEESSSAHRTPALASHSRRCMAAQGGKDEGWWISMDFLSRQGLSLAFSFASASTSRKWSNILRTDQDMAWQCNVWKNRVSICIKYIDVRTVTWTSDVLSVWLFPGQCGFYSANSVAV